MSAPSYICPAPGCDREFTAAEKDGKKCPCGKVELKYVRMRRDNKLTGTYVLEEDQQVPPASTGEEPEAHPLEEAGGERIDNNESPPEIWQMPSFVHPNTGKEVKTFKVFYRNTIHQGSVHCPDCRKKLWQNIYLHTISGIETVCPRCGAKTEFHFNAPTRLGINR